LFNCGLENLRVGRPCCGNVYDSRDLGYNQAHGDEEHVGYAVLKPAGYEGHDGEEYTENLTYHVFAGQSQPYRHTYQPVTEDPPEECGAPGQLQFAFGYIQGFSSYRPVKQPYGL